MQALSLNTLRQLSTKTFKKGGLILVFVVLILVSGTIFSSSPWGGAQYAYADIQEQCATQIADPPTAEKPYKNMEECIAAAENAQAAVPDQKISGADEKSLDFGKMASMLVSIFTPLVAILVDFVGKLMGNDVVLGSFGSATASSFIHILNTVWLVIRDLVNYAFILVLLGIAFMSVFSAALPENNNFELKKMLPKFIVALVSVNFTWFAGMIILDVANVTTHIVFAIPKTLIGESGVSFVTDDQGCRMDELGAAISAAIPEKVDETNLEQTIAAALSTLDGYYTSALGNTKEPAAKENLQQERLRERAKIENAQAKELMALKNPKLIGCLPQKVIVKNYTTKQIEYQGPVVASSLGQDPLVGPYTQGAKYVEDFGKFVIVWSDFNWDRFDSNSIAALFAYNVLQIQNLPRSVRTSLTGSVGVEDLIVNAGFALVFMIVTLIAFLVMVVVLFERIIIIWMNLVLSPLAALLPFATDFGLDAPGGDDVGIGIKPFLKFAFFPALMALPLVLGYILIWAGQQITTSAGILDERIIFETELINGIHTIHHLLWYALAVAVLWSSVKVAEGTAIHLKGLVEGITEKAKGIGKFIASSPLYANFIPIYTKDGEPTGEGSLASFGKLFDVDKLKYARDQEAQQTASKISGMQTPQADSSAIRGNFDGLKSEQKEEVTGIVKTIAEQLGKDRDVDAVLRDLHNNPLMKQLMGGNVNSESLLALANGLKDKGGELGTNAQKIVQKLNDTPVTPNDAANTAAPISIQKEGDNFVAKLGDQEYELTTDKKQIFADALAGKNFKELNTTFDAVGKEVGDVLDGVSVQDANGKVYIAQYTNSQYNLTPQERSSTGEKIETQESA